MRNLDSQIQVAPITLYVQNPALSVCVTALAHHDPSLPAASYLCSLHPTRLESVSGTSQIGRILRLHYFGPVIVADEAQAGGSAGLGRLSSTEDCIS